MQKFFCLIALTCLGIYPLHTQDLQISEDPDRDSTLVENHWSDKSTEPYALLKRKSDNTIGQGGQPTDQLSLSNLSEMTVYKPKGNYKMRVFEVDSTKQFHLKIYKAL